MNEGGAMQVSDELKAKIRPDTKLISCLAAWNSKDPTKVIPEANKNNIGLYGFCKPSSNTHSLITLKKFMHKPFDTLKGDQKNISALARSYHGVGLNAVWNGADGFLPAEKNAEDK